MSIRVVCPNQHPLKIKDKYAGKTGLCPICKARVQVPFPDTIPFRDEDIMDVLQPHESGLSLVESAASDCEDKAKSSDSEEKLGELVPVDGIVPITLTRTIVRVGRDKTCDVVLQPATVSRRHAELRLVRGRWLVEDKGSRNGTRVNGARITTAWLHSGDTVTFGTQKYMILWSTIAPGAPEPAPWRALDETVML